MSRVLRNHIAGVVRRDEPLSRYTSYRLGGPADIFVAPDGVEDVAAVMRLAAEAGAPVTVLGGGSNLLVADEGLRGVVLRVGRQLNEIAFEGETVRAQCGAPFPRLANMAARRGLSGLEFAGGVPGTLGGALAMNAGAHADDVAAVVVDVTAVDGEGGLRTFDREAMAFGYRMSRLQREPGLVAVAATLRLKPGNPEAIRKKMREFLHKRRQTQPLGTYNAGSVFKNPPGDFAGRLLEAAGCKGMTEGDAVVSPLHANFVVNRGEATARDVRTLIHRMQRRVKDRFGVELEPEVRMVGFGR